jgi:methyltransferase family protein
MNLQRLVQDNNGIFISEEDSGKISYPESGNNDCFGIERDSFWFNHRNNVIKEILLKFPHSDNFADIGGGNGYQANFIKKNFPEKEIFLIEPGYQGCLNAKKYGVQNIYNIPFQKFDFKEKNIGGVGLFDVIEHIEDEISFLKDIVKYCVPKTLVYITVPAYDWLWSDTDDYAGHYRRYNSKLMKSIANKSGLDPLYIGFFMFYLPLPILFFRGIPYRIQGKRDQKTLLKEASGNHIQSSLTVKIITLLNAFEIGSIHKFGRLLLGGSCIAVFQTK